MFERYVIGQGLERFEREGPSMGLSKNPANQVSLGMTETNDANCAHPERFVLFRVG